MKKSFVIMLGLSIATLFTSCAEEKCAREDTECRVQCVKDKCGETDLANMSLNDIAEYFKCSADANVSCIDTGGKCAKEDASCADKCIKIACGDFSDKKLGDLSFNEIASYNKCVTKARKDCVEE